MSGYACECGEAVKWYTPTGEPPVQVQQFIDDHQDLEHQEVQSWEAARIRDEIKRGGKRSQKASYRKRTGSSTVKEEPIMEAPKRVLIKSLNSGASS